MSPEVDTRLAGLQIERIAVAKEYVLYGRGSCMAMVHGTHMGSSGYMTDSGPAYLVWRNGQAFLVSRGQETPATDDQVETIERFSKDLKNALWPPINADRIGA